jgi:hypothetical protein
MKTWGKQFCLKGIMSIADAKRAVDIGATAIMVSNHGGRQLDCRGARLSDGSIGIEQTLANLVQGRAATEDEVVAEFDLREEQPVAAPRLLLLSCGEKGGDAPATFGRMSPGLEE